MNVVNIFKRQITVAHIFGIPVRCDYRWFIVFFLSVWLIAMNLSRGGMWVGSFKLMPVSVAVAWLLAVVTTVGLFLSVLGHELSHALMGRFGNVALVNGEPGWELEVASGEVARLYLTNVSNTRTWNVSLPGVRMKLVANDVGRFERQEWVESVAIAPAERYVVEARFDRAGPVPLLHRVHGIDMVYGN